MLKPWNHLPIIDNGEKLVEIPEDFYFVEPHPYYKLGAPYLNKNKLWNLREGVVSRLIMANNFLKANINNHFLIVYDTWRPIEVQKYMFNFAFESEGKKLGLNISFKDMKTYPELVKKVEKFWAYPSFDINSPPPHSTGAALDITLVDSSGRYLDMGCHIDQMDDYAKPDYFKNSKKKEAIIWHTRRILLKEIMQKFGFVQHPNEWWHFSYGDQLWAWLNKQKQAIYGKYSYFD